ncbi:MAG TPA: Rieske (2Fe-2S) protein [Candidatus Dormibacteraeota bacterium]|nr:Rieske (2Fe-2S) protein [Candidatus Dormibacteraeota bacterium]
MSRSERRIARFVEDLLRNRRPRRFRASPEDLAVMRAAAELRASRLGADLPDPVFVDRLGRRLRQELTGETVRALSRRRLLLGAGGAAAAAVAGGMAGIAGDRLAGGTGEGGDSRELVPAGATWRPVMAAAAVADGQAVRFSTGAIEGFVVNRDGRYQALSAVCTHLGCLLQQAGPGRLSCPCHRTAFGLDGTVLFHELPRTPRALPLLRTRVRAGQVEVFTA